jgi:hypothetical protein
MDHENNLPLSKPKNWLVESIIVTILCCLPFGIVGIVYSSQVNSKYAAGDYEGALQASKSAGMWTKIGFFIGLAFIVLYALAVFGIIGAGLFPTLPR